MGAGIDASALLAVADTSACLGTPSLPAALAAIASATHHATIAPRMAQRAANRCLQRASKPSEDLPIACVPSPACPARIGGVNYGHAFTTRGCCCPRFCSRQIDFTLAQ